MKTLTTICVQGNEQEVFEVYSNDGRDQTIGFTFDENDANILGAGRTMLDTLKHILNHAKNTFVHYEEDECMIVMIKNAIKRAEGIHERLEYLRGEIRAERISLEELSELASLAEHIDKGDVELLEAAGVPEHDEEVI